MTKKKLLSILGEISTKDEVIGIVKSKMRKNIAYNLLQADTPIERKKIRNGLQEAINFIK